MERVQLSRDGKKIKFQSSKKFPATPKKFRQSPEVKGFYRFIYENNLRKEALEIIISILEKRKNSKK